MRPYLWLRAARRVKFASTSKYTARGNLPIGPPQQTGAEESAPVGSRPMLCNQRARLG